MRIQISSLVFLFSISLSAWGARPEPTYVSKSYPETFATGLIHSQSSEAFLRAAPRKSFVSEKTSIPATFSMKGKTGQIENQGSCGSCWDFSLTSALRGTWAMAGKDSGRLSLNYLLNCNSQGYGCWGGSFDAADAFQSPKGAPKYGVDGEYTGSIGSCVEATPVASAIQYYMIGTDGANPSFKDIAYVVGVLHRPVSIMITADSTLQAYAGGVYNGCSPGDSNGGNHLVVIEGYDCESSVDKSGQCVFDKDGNLPAGVGLFIVRNSWGKSWGDNGYLITKATDENGERCNGIATYALYFEVK
jgi:C1A family cysteine protease